MIQIIFQFTCQRNERQVSMNSLVSLLARMNFGAGATAYRHLTFRRRNVFISFNALLFALFPGRFGGTEIGTVNACVTDVAISEPAAALSTSVSVVGSFDV
ncbi:hypothetical protein [Burkholderia lata]|uniref:hypothetical protein n=1 Tax=Burkholderia lata (strain ATCC 17760 / DSM 23089 / LMG 22485 / NCIMB 9086 / R18194 / 383) TaxID=482957 RepID=UPI002431EF88|nr:hypothetical protein [Burkholderia lata]